MRISIVVAAARNGVIGRAGGLPWKLSDDLKRFRSLTLGHPVIMGRKTYESIGGPLSERINIVVSRNLAAFEGIILARSLDEALRLGAEAAAHLDVSEIFIIGGAEIYAAALPFTTRIYLTEVDAESAGDSRFPAIEPADWSRRLAGAAAQSSRNEHSCRFFVLDRS